VVHLLYTNIESWGCAGKTEFVTIFKDNK